MTVNLTTKRLLLFGIPAIAIDFFAALVPSVERGYLTEEEISQIKKFVE